MNRSIFIVGMLLFASAIYGQTEVSAGVSRGKDFGVVYMLPKTEIEVEVKTAKMVYTPGKFSKYADRYLRLTNVSHEAEEYWLMTDIDVKSVGVPDKAHTYFVKMKDKSVAPLVELTADGIIKSMNVAYEYKQGEHATTETIATKAKKKKLDPFSFLTEEILTTNSSAKMAELIAKEIYNIRESKNTLLRGQADNTPQDGAQLKLMLDNLNEQEEALLTLFIGTEEKEDKTYPIRITPGEEWENKILFRFSKKLGMVSADNLAGEPVYITLKDLQLITAPSEPKRKGIEGVAYNVPGRAEITITKDKETLFKGEFPITQFGVVEYLTPTLFSGKTTIKVLFNTTTGGLAKVDKGNAK
ncbi:hypothetical protein EZS27_003055 [termite gut metagenome]|uniref:DUF4831 family protein n=1 Tax=termite gut metagenome TaxID=433724 RepID=A0A5J4STU4_9ZZZZ